MTPFLHRPRLAEHALVRRHVIDGEETVVIHDTRTGDLARMGPREWEMLISADGTRDFDGLVLAAAKRGALHRASQIEVILERLQAMGLLADGIDHADPPAPAVDRPLSVLPDFSLSCDASGACCGVYGSILFTPAEAARARAALPQALAAPAPDPAAEAFYLRAVIHGHQLVGRLPLALALRDRAVRLLVARAMGALFPDARRPLTILEAMLRGHRIEIYAREVRT